ncbi:amidohydrolase family protein [Candidatus Woesearchaeota archaeon]|nr:amidohydrolase family protein [Candidatus Woesearchaeota archaeon]
MSLSIKNCRIIHNGKLISTNIFIDNGKITKIGGFVDADEILDAHNNIVLPGVIDPHVHFREPGFEYKEDLLSGSRAAAAGGATTFLDMPNTNPTTTTIEALQEKRELARKCVVNYGFHFGSSENNIDEIRKAANTASLKIYMNPTTGNMKLEDEGLLRDLFSSHNTIAVHAEDEMIRKAVDLSNTLKNKLYICHQSTKEGLDYINQNRGNILVETTPHHLFLTEEDQNQFVKMKPPLVTKQDQEALWQGIHEGSINTIGTDHAPHTISEKESGEFFGVPGVETSLPLLFNAVNKNMLSLQQLIELTSHNPARIFGIKNKGFIEQGFDADFVIVDPHLTKKVKNEELFTKCGWSPFNNWELEGWPITTIVNGNVVFEHGEVYDIKAREVVFNG